MKLATGLGSTCPQLFFLIILTIALGLMVTIIIMVYYGITAYRRRQTVDVQRTASFPGINTESAYSSSSDY